MLLFKVIEFLRSVFQKAAKPAVLQHFLRQAPAIYFIAALGGLLFPAASTHD
jgi:hypothetical protein